MNVCFYISNVICFDTMFMYNIKSLKLDLTFTCLLLLSLHDPQKS